MVSMTAEASGNGAFCGNGTGQLQGPRNAVREIL